MLLKNFLINFLFQILSIEGQHEKFQLSLSVYHHMKNKL